MGDEGSIRDIHELFNVNVICTHAYGHISSVRSALPHHSYLNVLTMGAHFRHWRIINSSLADIAGGFLPVANTMDLAPSFGAKPWYKGIQPAKPHT